MTDQQHADKFGWMPGDLVHVTSKEQVEAIKVRIERTLSGDQPATKQDDKSASSQA